jgi:hypothetical protein
MFDKPTFLPVIQKNYKNHISEQIRTMAGGSKLLPQKGGVAAFRLPDVQAFIACGTESLQRERRV